MHGDGGLVDAHGSLAGRRRILVLGRTGSGKTTLAREVAAKLDLPHVELDALYFDADYNTVSTEVLRERVRAAIGGDAWITDGNKRTVRDLVWPRADTVVWLDYPLRVSLWRLARRGRQTASRLRTEAAERGDFRALPRRLLGAATGVTRALRSHAGQRREYERLFADGSTAHLSIVRLRSPRATREWLANFAS